MSVYASYPILASGVPIYSTLAAFPATAVTGALGVAADTGNLYEFNGVSWQLIGGPGGVFTVGPFGSSPNANGASVSGGTLTLQPADGTHPGGVSILAQTLAGAKTFSTAPILSSLSASLPLQLDGSKNIISTAIDLSGSQATGILAAGRFPALLGDITTSAGSLTTSLVATTNSTLTTLSGLTTASSLASVGTITSGTWNATTLAVAHGGTGQITAAAAFNALSPITTTGDMIYSPAGATSQRLAVGSTGNVLTVSGGVPTWAPPASSGTVTAVSVASANGLAGSSSGGATPSLTLSTTINSPVLAGNGTAIAAATTTGTGSTVVLSASPTLSGTLGIGAAAASQRGLNVSGTLTGATTQKAILAGTTFDSGATAAGLGFHSNLSTAAASFTMPWVADFTADTLTVGSGSTVTNHVGFFGSASGGTNVAQFTDNTSFTGSWLINQSGTAPSSLNSVLQVKGSTAPANGAGVELSYGAIASTGRIFAFDRGGGGRQPMVVDGSTVALYIAGNPAVSVDVSKNVTLAAAFSTQAYGTSSATSGTITAAANTPGLLITGVGGTTLTIKLPSSPADGQQFWVGSQGAFTTVTWQDAGGTAGNVIGGQAAIGGATRGQTFVYGATATKWFSIS